MSEISAPVSPGELIDKITILEIKQERIKDVDKVKNVNLELELLESLWNGSVYQSSALVVKKRAELKFINEELWVIEDDLRLKESKAEFDRDFIELARSVYLTNDRRASVKREINLEVGSKLIEEKSYQDYSSDSPAGTDT
ncbi:MAG: DUF6165 family protein [Gammaproteobacteria bacterium]|jgi:hypothetical protein|nr:DUF6165 family protein [Gammaproteobacteria bacterium]